MSTIGYAHGWQGLEPACTSPEYIHRNTTHKGQQMKKSEFVVICNKFCVPPSVALESDAVVSAIKFVSSYPACMHSDAIAYVEDVMSAEF